MKVFQAMKPMSQLIILIFVIFASVASAHAQSLREQLMQMVEQLQKTPTDNALREKIITLAQQVKPTPAVPEEAQRREGRGKFAFKTAKSNDDYLGAAREYEEAVRIAPWVSGYYSDLCTIYEKAEKYAEAKRHCEFSLTGLTDPSQIYETKQRIAGLEFGIEQAGKQEKIAVPKDLSGKWGEESDLQQNSYIVEIYKSASGNWRARVSHDGAYESFSNTIRWQHIETLESFDASKDRVVFVIKSFIKSLDHAQTSNRVYKYSLSVSTDGQVLSGSREAIDYRNQGTADADVVNWTRSVTLKRL